jgi:xanthine/uracil permease
VCGAVVGVVAIVAADLLEASVNFPGFNDNPTVEQRLDNVSKNALAAVVYLLTLGVLYKFTNKYTAIILVVVGALAGQYLFL